MATTHNTIENYLYKVHNITKDKESYNDCYKVVDELLDWLCKNTSEKEFDFYHSFLRYEDGDFDKLDIYKCNAVKC